MKLKQKYLTKCILVLFLLTITKNMTLAQEEESQKEETNYYFDFIPSSYQIQAGKEMEISLITKSKNLKKENWRVRPAAANTLISVYNENKQEWVFTSKPWSEMPQISNQMKLKINSPQEQINLKLLILDQKNAKTYETPEKTLWTIKAYNNYYQKLNENLTEWRQNHKRSSTVSNEEETVTTEHPPQTKQITEFKNNKTMAYINLGALACAGIVGFIRKNDKIPS